MTQHGCPPGRSLIIRASIMIPADHAQPLFFDSSFHNPVHSKESHLLHPD